MLNRTLAVCEEVNTRMGLPAGQPAASGQPASEPASHQHPPLDVALTKLFGSYDGRDRIARFFQYGARFVVGCTTNSSCVVSQQIRIFAARFLTFLGSSRRTFRWGKEVPVLIHLARCWNHSIDDPVLRTLEISQTLFLLLFLFTDHVSWLLQIRFGLRGGARSIQWSFRFLTISSVLSTSSAIKKLLSLPGYQLTVQETATFGRQREAYMFSILRNGLMALQAAHNSSLFTTHNAIVGALGMVTSIMDVTQVWPEWKLLLGSSGPGASLVLHEPPRTPPGQRSTKVDEQPSEPEPPPALQRSSSAMRFVLDWVRSD